MSELAIFLLTIACAVMLAANIYFTIRSGRKPTAAAAIEKANSALLYIQELMHRVQHLEDGIKAFKCPIVESDTTAHPGDAFSWWQDAQNKRMVFANDPRLIVLVRVLYLDVQEIFKFPAIVCNPGWQIGFSPELRTISGEKTKIFGPCSTVATVVGWCQGSGANQGRIKLGFNFGSATVASNPQALEAVRNIEMYAQADYILMTEADTTNDPED